MSKIKIAPSILSADFANMATEIKRIEQGGADLVHCDVMDGVFVPNITFGIKMVADIRKVTNLPLDVHLMIVNPEKYVQEFAKAGADYIKTSTGFSKAGATFADIKLFADNVGADVRIKAAGGIRSFEDAEAFLDLGAERLGTSRLVSLLKGAKEKSNY